MTASLINEHLGCLSRAICRANDGNANCDAISRFGSNIREKQPKIREFFTKTQYHGEVSRVGIDAFIQSYGAREPILVMCYSECA